MSTSLKDKARAAAAESWGDIPPGEVAAHTIDPSPAVQEEATPLQPFVELAGPTSDDPPQVPVVVAWARVMRDVHGIGKNSVYSAPGTRYNFRGVDAMINAFGPSCRRHGIILVPTAVRSTHDDATTSKGNPTRETTAIVSWRVYGPMGDYFDGESEGESLDSGDKGTAKAQSVALRVFLIAAGLVPTDEKDPDSQHIERGVRPTVRPADYVEEICDKRTSLARLRQISVEIKRHGVGTAIVQNENGDDEQLLALCTRIGTARRAAEGGE